LERERFGDPACGDAAWVTVFSADRGPTDTMSAKLADLAPRGGRLAPHRYAQPEIDDIVEGAGTVTVAEVETAVTAGAAVFIPGDAEHGIHNDGDSALRFFCVFPADRFSDVVYRFS
jgi:quercetin dioxygenase-like cupin family protein